jgi:hypothetical protein
VRAINGSIFVARRTGMAHAARATVASRPLTAKRRIGCRHPEQLGLERPPQQERAAAAEE